MLQPIYSIDEAEANILKENALINNFALERKEVIDMPLSTMNYLLRLLVRRNQNKKFEEMKIKNAPNRI